MLLCMWIAQGICLCVPVFPVLNHFICLKIMYCLAGNKLDSLYILEGTVLVKSSHSKRIGADCGLSAICRLLQVRGRANRRCVMLQSAGERQEFSEKSKQESHSTHWQAPMVAIRLKYF